MPHIEIALLWTFEKVVLVRTPTALQKVRV
jgi:hypothetical protein